MRWLVAVGVFVLHAVASAQEARPKPASVDATIERGLGFLVKDAQAWKEQHKCVSCHHAGLVVWAMREGRQGAHSVDKFLMGSTTLPR